MTPKLCTSVSSVGRSYPVCQDTSPFCFTNTCDLSPTSDDGPCLGWRADSNSAYQWISYGQVGPLPPSPPLPPLPPPVVMLYLSCCSRWRRGLKTLAVDWVTWMFLLDRRHFWEYTPSTVLMWVYWKVYFNLSLYSPSSSSSSTSLSLSSSSSSSSSSSFWQWVVTEQGCNCYSRVLVPLYDTLGSEAVVYIINQGEQHTKIIVQDIISVIASFVYRLICFVILVFKTIFNMPLHSHR